MLFLLLYFFYKYTCSFIFIFILILHATHQTHFLLHEKTMKSIYIVLIVVSINVVLMLCYFILKLCIKSHTIYSDNEQNNNELNNQIGNIELNQVQINLFPIFRFSKHEMYLEYHICFDEFADGDEIIIFPICKHIYHTRYITPWLLGLHLIFTIY